MTGAASRKAEPTEARIGSADGYALEEQIGFLLRKAHQRASEIFAGVMSEFGVTPTQFAAMAKLDDAGPMPQNQLGKLTAMDPATIFSVVGRLAKRGWVRQASDANDGRLVIVSLTADGVRAIRSMKNVAADVSQLTSSPLSDDEAQVFLSLLKRLT